VSCLNCVNGDMFDDILVLDYMPTNMPSGMSNIMFVDEL
jgi:hypothetical protein